MSTRGSVRRCIRIARPACDVWAMVGDPVRLAEWFPGITSCTVDGDCRVVITGTGLPMPQQLLTIDPLQRRFQYRVTAPVFREHLATIDVYPLGDGTCLVAYAVDADPATMALVLGGAAGNALRNLRAVMEGVR